MGAPVIHGTDSHAEKTVWCSDTSKAVWSCSILASHSADQPQFLVRLVLRILHRCKFHPVAASVLNVTFETEVFQRSHFEYSRQEFQLHFYHTWSATRGENLDPVLRVCPLPFC